MSPFKAAYGLLLVLAALSQSAYAEEACSLKKLGTMQAQITPDNQLVVQTKIHGMAVPLLLDTGAVWNGISRAMAQRLGLQFLNANAFMRPIGGEVLTERVEIGEIELGNVKSSTLNFYGLHKGGDGTDGKAAGVLAGANQLMDLEIDPAGNVVNFFDQDHCTGKTVYWSGDYGVLPVHKDKDTNWMTVDVELDGQKLKAMIDTGASWSLLPSGIALDRFGLSDSSPDMVPTEGVTIDSQPQAASAHTFQSLKIGDIVIHNPRIMVATLRHDTDMAGSSHMNRQALYMPDLLIGMNILKNFHMFIAYREDAIYYTGVNAGRVAKQ
ncbi:MAG TPA: retroviral-like aspartic protease family protein [Aliidongia sp.]|nr:retroviral-like aspartic protease family protein [Aliidongia sp.]